MYDTISEKQDYHPRARLCNEGYDDFGRGPGLWLLNHNPGPQNWPSNRLTKGWNLGPNQNNNLLK